MSISVQFLWQGAAPWDSLAINIGIFDKTPAKPLGNIYWSKLPFSQVWNELVRFDWYGAVVTKYNYKFICWRSCSVFTAMYQKTTPLLSKPSLNPSVTKCQRLSPATHKLTSAASTLDRWWWTVSTASPRGVVRARAPSSHSVKTTGPAAAAIYPANTVCPVARSRRLSDRQQQGGGTDVGPRLTGNPDPEHASSVKLEGLTCKLLPKQRPPVGTCTLGTKNCGTQGGQRRKRATTTT